MVDFSDIYIFSDQPPICPKCGLRSEIILDLSHTSKMTQVHKCLNRQCEHEFVMQYDSDFDI